MDLNTGRLLWDETYPNPPKYPALNENISCDVLIIGGGEAGALCAWKLSELGLDTVMIERLTIGRGSTVANTGLLQYANDTPLYQLMKVHGEETAVRFYKLCQWAVDELESIAQTVPDPVEYFRRDSIYYASNERDVEIIDNEYKALKQNGFPVDYLVESEVRDLMGFSKPRALLTHGDAEVNPYRLAHALTYDASHKNLRVYENTEVLSLNPSGKSPLFFTTQGYQVKSKYAIIASGYEVQEQTPLPGAEVMCTYALATEPVNDFGPWRSRALIWETARPYLYLRTTADHRILMGGLDGSVSDGKGRDSVLLQKTDQLKVELDKLFPQFKDTKVAYRWASSFGSTQDGMPLIGRHPHNPNCFYASGFGGNGTVYYSIAADVLASLIVKGTHPDENIFAPTRMKWYKSAARHIKQTLF